MPLFPSPEWMEDFAARLATHPEADMTAEALDGVYRFVIEPAAGLVERHHYDVEIRPGQQGPDGGGARVTPLDAPVDDPRLTITAAYDRWQQLLRGELDIPMAVLLRRIKIAGDLGALTKKGPATRPLLDALSGVDSTFLSTR